ncbi:TRAP transporter substrate-binding protein [Corticibacter populi]|uniref:TRAP transporter substrate-binding protein n=1 Tax=Corticibacter populi TaxID=1550736 RepID=A0A3M6QVX9_9BURK|nr:TRAP transporter substrate-binding protein [Corticibacter populi]RMX06652.1 TRAP transporter substrate-binding protein [Corticibacter populi]RZS31774.1 TRAP-type C4-dicarboxylate transport system substrate-binding protein [Corticibacter populi]
MPFPSHRLTKWTGRLLHAVAFTAACTTAGLSHAQTLRMGHVTAPTHVWSQVADRIGSNLAEATGGKTKVANNPLAKLGNEAQMINLLQSGAMPLGILTAGALSNREESFLAWSLPYTFTDVAHATRATQTPAAQTMLERLEPHGMVGLGYAMAGMRHVLSATEIRTATDLANQKIRSFPSPIYNDWWTANHAAPTAMPLSEVAPSLTTKLLDAVDVDLDALVSMKYHQQAPYLSLTNHMAFPSVIVVSKRHWDRLSEAERATLRAAVEEAQAWGFEQAIAAEARNLATAKADGAQISTPDLASFEQVAAPVRSKYITRNALIGAFHQQATALK